MKWGMIGTQQQIQVAHRVWRLFDSVLYDTRSTLDVPAHHSTADAPKNTSTPQTPTGSTASPGCSQQMAPHPPEAQTLGRAPGLSARVKWMVLAPKVPRWHSAPAEFPAWQCLASSSHSGASDGTRAKLVRTAHRANLSATATAPGSSQWVAYVAASADRSAHVMRLPAPSAQALQSRLLEKGRRQELRSQFKSKSAVCGSAHSSRCAIAVIPSIGTRFTSVIEVHLHKVHKTSVGLKKHVLPWAGMDKARICARGKWKKRDPLLAHERVAHTPVAHAHLFRSTWGEAYKREE
jgi:hypothetical protein